MIKYLVVWVVINSWIVPCDHGPSVTFDEYGQRHESMSTTLELCYDSETLHKEKYFDTYKEALAFVEKGKESCGGKWDCPLSGWEIKEIEIKNIDHNKALQTDRQTDGGG